MPFQVCYVERILVRFLPWRNTLKILQTFHQRIKQRVYCLFVTAAVSISVYLAVLRTSEHYIYERNVKLGIDNIAQQNLIFSFAIRSD